jgi:hypothetical protein
MTERVRRKKTGRFSGRAVLPLVGSALLGVLVSAMIRELGFYEAMSETARLFAAYFSLPFGK